MSGTSQTTGAGVSQAKGHAGKPPMMQGANLTSHGIDGALLTSLTTKGGATQGSGNGSLPPSKWSINIQEIVKRTQKNLERGPSSSKAASGLDKRTLDAGANSSELQYLSKQTKIGFGSSSTKDKNSLLYNDLKKKLSYDSAPGAANPMASGAINTNVSAGINRRENLLSMGSQNSSKARGASLSNNTKTIGMSNSNQIGAKSLYLANQKSAASVGNQNTLNERLAIARLKRQGTNDHTGDVNSEVASAAAIARNMNERSNGNSVNDVSITTGSTVQATQGQVEMYYNEGQPGHEMPYQHEAPPSNSASRTIEERLAAHQRTLMEKGRLNLIGASQTEPDEESHFITGTGNSALRKNYNRTVGSVALNQPNMRRHNSNMNPPTSTADLAIEDQERYLVGQALREGMDDPNAIVEANLTEEQTHRYDTSSVERIADSSIEDAGPLMTKNLINNNTTGEHNILKLNYLKPSNSTGATNFGTLTETQMKRQTLDFKNKPQLGTGAINHRAQSRDRRNNQNHASNVEHRQKIFEEEIIKRIKEIQRYVKSLHLQIKKTQASQEKLKEEVDSDKDVLISLQQQVELQNKRHQTDRLKQVSQAELETSLKDFEHRYNEKLVLVVQQAADQTLQQVRDEIVPDTRLKMYDSITEETNRVKHDIEYQISGVKREMADGQKKEKQKNTDLIEKEVQSLKKEMLSEQSTQTLQILSQVDGQIAKALKEHNSQVDTPTVLQLEEMRSDLNNKIKAVESKMTQELREKVSISTEQVQADFEQRLTDLKNRLTEQLKSKINTQASQLVSPEFLSERLLQLKQDLVKLSKDETRKAIEGSKSEFIAPDTLQSELTKLKRDVSKQVKTGLEEAKFDSVQMVQSDIVELNNQHKDSRFKVQELTGSVDEIRNQFEEAILRLKNREKEQAKLQAVQNQLSDRCQGFEGRLDSLDSNLRDLQNKETLLRSAEKQSSVKEDKLDSYRSTAQHDQVLVEEIELLKKEVHQVSNHCKDIEAQVHSTDTSISSLKSSVDKQFKSVKSQLEEAQKQVIDVQFESTQNKQFLEDQLAEVCQNMEGLQGKLMAQDENQMKNIEAVKSEVKKLDQSSERQFQNLHSGVTLLEEWQKKMNEQEYSQRINTVQTTEASANKDDKLLLECQEQLDDLTQKVSDISKEQTEMSNLLQKVHQEQVDSQSQRILIQSIPNMVSTLSERNERLEEQVERCVKDISECRHEVQKTVTIEKQERQVEVEKVRAEIEEVANQGRVVAQEVVQAEMRQFEKGLETLGQQVRDEQEKMESRLEKEKAPLSAITDLQEKINEIQEAAENNHEQLERQIAQMNLQPRSLRSSVLNSQSKWQESSVKKIEVKKAAGWNEVRMTKVEPKDQLLTSSNLMVNSSMPSTNGQDLLKSLPPQDDVQDQELPFSRASDKKQPTREVSALLTPEKKDSQLQPINTSSHMHLAVANQNQSPASIAQPSNISEIDHTNTSHQPTTLRDYPQPSESEIEIKSPVQFEMLPESDVKVNETNSSQANLLLQDRYEDDVNLNDQIISPSEGIQVPNADFYKLQREIRSNQVMKKNEIAIKMQVEQEIESQKVESPKPLDSVVCDFDAEKKENSTEHKDTLQKTKRQLHLPSEASVQSEEKGADKEEDGENEGEDELKETGQLFKTQKMSGLLMLNKDSSEIKDSEVDPQDQESPAKKEPTQPDEEENSVDGGVLPASVAVLGMKLGNHQRKDSESKSSVMGLSALGLESHRESVDPNNLLEDVAEGEEEQIPPLTVEKIESDMLKLPASDEEVSVQKDASPKKQDFNSLDKEAQVDQVIQALVGLEIVGALQIMGELGHPGAHVE